MSTESELVKEAFSDTSFLKQVKSLELMLRVRERGFRLVSGATTGECGIVLKGGSPSRCEREGAGSCLCV